MTIEELKAIQYIDLRNAYMEELFREIMALVEAAEDARLADTNMRGIELILGDALDAFNAKLAAL